MELILKENNQRYEIKGVQIDTNGDVYFAVQLPEGLQVYKSDYFRTPVNYLTQYISDLEDTYDLMISSNYKDRMVAEYLQLVIRKDKLMTLIRHAEQDKLQFKPTCSLEILKEQYSYMDRYGEILEQRMILEGIHHVQGWFDYEESTKTSMHGIPF